MKAKTTTPQSCWLYIVTVLLVTVFSTGLQAAEFKVVYHLDDTRNGRFALVLAKDHLEMNPDAKIAIVAYAAGVDFLLKGAADRRDKAYEPDVVALMKQGVQFKVCAATLGFRDISKEQVLANIPLVPSGTYEIVRLQAEESYVYLKP